MEPRPPQVRRFGDRDIAKILRRAAELQRSTPARPDPSGLTLAELEEIAVEAGIDVENVRRAASELARPSDHGDWVSTLLGAPITYRMERRVEGELPTEAFSGLIPLLQAGTGTTGQATTVGRALTWASTGGDNKRTLHILVMAEKGETLIQVEERAGQIAAAFHAGFGAGGFGFGLPVGMSLGAAAGALPGIALGVAITGVGYALGRTFYKLTTRRRQRILLGLVDRLEARIRELLSAAALPGSASEALPPG